MVLDSTDANSVVLVAKELLMEQASDMNLFIVTEHSLVNMTHPKKGVKMEVKLKRKIMRKKTPSEMDVAPWITHLIFNIYTLDFNKFN